PGAAAHAELSKNPLLLITRTVLDDEPLIGRVEQQLRTGGYTYLAVRSEEGLQWAVTLGSGAAVGARVSVRSMGHRTAFYSRRLERTFDELRFGIVTRLEEEKP